MILSCRTVPSCRFPSKSAVPFSLILNNGTGNRCGKQSFLVNSLIFTNKHRSFYTQCRSFSLFILLFFFQFFVKNAHCQNIHLSATLVLTELSVIRTYGCGFSHMRLRIAPHSLSHFCFFSLTGSSFEARSSAASLTQNARLHDFF